MQCKEAEKLLELAMSNLGLLEAVYTVDALHLLERDIRALVNRPVGGPVLEKLRVNTGDSSSVDERMQQLEELGATKITFNRIKQMTVLDQMIWSHFNRPSEILELRNAS